MRPGPPSPAADATGSSPWREVAGGGGEGKRGCAEGRKVPEVRRLTRSGRNVSGCADGRGARGRVGATYPAKSAEGQSSPLGREERHSDVAVVRGGKGFNKKKCNGGSCAGWLVGPAPGGGGRGHPERDSVLGPIAPPPGSGRRPPDWAARLPGPRRQTLRPVREPALHGHGVHPGFRGALSLK